MLHFRRWLALVLAALTAILWAVPSLAEGVTPEDYNRSTPQVLEEGHLHSEAAILIDAFNGDVLFSKNARERMYPASTTKVMTLLLALESGISLGTEIVIPQEASKIPADSSLVPVFPGDQMTFRDLLYGFMLTSGNDGANAIAVLVCGSVDTFVDRMNDRAVQLGCTDTHFANPHGYHDPRHYTTARDMSLIAQQAMRMDDFRKIVASPSYTLSIRRGGEQMELPVNNSNMLIRKGNSYYFEECIGVKTGYHSMAGQCFVGAAERDGMRLISVVFKGAENTDKWVDTIRLFRYGFTRYTEYSLEQMFSFAKDRIATVKISNAAHDDPGKGNLDLDIAQISDPEYGRMIETDSSEAMQEAIADFVSRSELIITSDLAAPVVEGQIMGNFRYVDQSGKEVSALLIADRSIEEQPATLSAKDIFPFLRAFDNPLVKALVIVIALLILVLILYAVVNRRYRERRRARLYEVRRREYMEQKRMAQRRAARARWERENARRKAAKASRKKARSDDYEDDDYEEDDYEDYEDDDYEEDDYEGDDYDDEDGDDDDDLFGSY